MSLDLICQGSIPCVIRTGSQSDSFVVCKRANLFQNLYTAQMRQILVTQDLTDLDVLNVPFAWCTAKV